MVVDKKKLVPDSSKQENQKKEPAKDVSFSSRTTINGEINLQEEFTAALTKYEAPIFRYLLGLTHNRELAEDLAQDTFIAAFRAWSSLTDPAKRSAWLYTIATNMARQYFRRRRLLQWLPLEGNDEHEEPVLASAGPAFDHNVVEQDAVQRVIAQLPAEHVTVLLLQILGGFSCEEIGLITRHSTNAVKIRLSRARALFRQLYEAQEQL